MATTTSSTTPTTPGTPGIIFSTCGTETNNESLSVSKCRDHGLDNYSTKQHTTSVESWEEWVSGSSEYDGSAEELSDDERMLHHHPPVKESANPCEAYKYSAGRRSLHAPHYSSDDDDEEEEEEEEGERMLGSAHTHHPPDVVIVPASPLITSVSSALKQLTIKSSNDEQKDRVCDVSDSYPSNSDPTARGHRTAWPGSGESGEKQIVAAPPTRPAAAPPGQPMMTRGTLDINTSCVLQIDIPKGTCKPQQLPAELSIAKSSGAISKCASSVVVCTTASSVPSEMSSSVYVNRSATSTGISEKKQQHRATDAEATLCTSPRGNRPTVLELGNSSVTSYTTFEQPKPFQPPPPHHQPSMSGYSSPSHSNQAGGGESHHQQKSPVSPAGRVNRPKLGVCAIRQQPQASRVEPTHSPKTPTTLQQSPSSPTTRYTIPRSPHTGIKTSVSTLPRGIAQATGIITSSSANPPTAGVEFSDGSTTMHPTLSSVDVNTAQQPSLAAFTNTAAQNVQGQQKTHSMPSIISNIQTLTGPTTGRPLQRIEEGSENTEVADSKAKTCESYKQESVQMPDKSISPTSLSAISPITEQSITKQNKLEQEQKPNLTHSPTQREGLEINKQKQTADPESEISSAAISPKLKQIVQLPKIVQDRNMGTIIINSKPKVEPTTTPIKESQDTSSRGVTVGKIPEIVPAGKPAIPIQQMSPIDHCIGSEVPSLIPTSQVSPKSTVTETVQAVSRPSETTAPSRTVRDVIPDSKPETPATTSVAPSPKSASSAKSDDVAGTPATVAHPVKLVASTPTLVAPVSKPMAPATNLVESKPLAPPAKPGSPATANVDKPVISVVPAVKQGAPVAKPVTSTPSPVVKSESPATKPVDPVAKPKSSTSTTPSTTKPPGAVQKLVQNPFQAPTVVRVTQPVILTGPRVQGTTPELVSSPKPKTQPTKVQEFQQKKDTAPSSTAQVQPHTKPVSSKDGLEPSANPQKATRPTSTAGGATVKQQPATSVSTKLPSMSQPTDKPPEAAIITEKTSVAKPQPLSVSVPKPQSPSLAVSTTAVTKQGGPVSTSQHSMARQPQALSSTQASSVIAVTTTLGTKASTAVAPSTINTKPQTEVSTMTAMPRIATTPPVSVEGSKQTVTTGQVSKQGAMANRLESHLATGKVETRSSTRQNIVSKSTPKVDKTISSPKQPPQSSVSANSTTYTPVTQTSAIHSLVPTRTPVLGATGTSGHPKETSQKQTNVAPKSITPMTKVVTSATQKPVPTVSSGLASAMGFGLSPVLMSASSAVSSVTPSQTVQSGAISKQPSETKQSHPPSVEKQVKTIMPNVSSATKSQQATLTSTTVSSGKTSTPATSTSTPSKPTAMSSVSSGLAQAFTFGISPSPVSTATPSSNINKGGTGISETPVRGNITTDDQQKKTTAEMPKSSTSGEGAKPKLVVEKPPRTAVPSGRQQGRRQSAGRADTLPVTAKPPSEGLTGAAAPPTPRLFHRPRFGSRASLSNVSRTSDSDTGSIKSAKMKKDKDCVIQ